MAIQAAPIGAHPLHQRLNALARQRSLGGKVERQAGVEAVRAFVQAAGPLVVQGEARAQAHAHARASGHVRAMPGHTDASFSAQAAGVMQAQTQVTAHALGVLSASVTGSASVAGVIHAEGRAVIGERQVGLEASAGAAAKAHLAAVATGRADLGVLQAQGSAGLVAEAAAEASAHGRAWIGIDSLGLPAFSLGAAARTDAAAGVRSHATGGVSILGLIEVSGAGSLKAMAGAASSFLGNIGFRDGKLSVGAGVGAAAGLGGEAQAGASVGLGKLPRGVTQAVVAPVISVPVLLTTSLVNGVASLFGEEPWEGNPGITDLPEVVAGHVKAGVQSIAEGAEEVVSQVAGGVSWLARQVGSLFD